MLLTGVENLDRSIERVNTWLADIDAGFGTSDRHLAYRVLRAWLHCLRDRLSVEVAAHFAAQLPELLRGTFFDGNAGGSGAHLRPAPDSARARGPELGSGPGRPDEAAPDAELMETPELADALFRRGGSAWCLSRSLTSKSPTGRM